jgi:hypothetical protein
MLETYFRSSSKCTRFLCLLTGLGVLAVISVLVISIVSVVSSAGAGESGHRARLVPQDDPDANNPHWLVGSYYNTKDGMTATLLLNNKGIESLEVRPRIYNLSGQMLQIPPLTVEPRSFRFVNLQEWVALGGESFAQGSVKLFHVGRDLVLGAQIYLTDKENSLSFEEKLAEVDKFDSRRLEASGGCLHIELKCNSCYQTLPTLPCRSLPNFRKGLITPAQHIFSN